ncbi:hypothetical protein F4V57_13980 [Acinetobacter qingfengensis]|uniref:Single-stranded DNA-binding protein n=1 Tax=Acinetobacter qingfengensis TaxID=1262585 RepID=A0A1E7QYX0_9GAMM|nr:hypothetical protein [Acinetobacter qingfengensis]KAA8730961.1 hypothetical protein F4V57_13980 [Acinetobacter qingfengensis]OEY92259.1 hypothetical protein BJI46_05790 [Acinetobacter qingfengensis]
MLMNATIKVLGAKKSKGDFNGKPYDNTVLYQEVSMKQGEDYLGAASEEIKWGNSSNFDHLKVTGIKFPFVADVTLEQVTNGRTSTLVIVDLKPQVQAKN